MTVPALLVMVPGSSALRTLLYFDSGDVNRAVAQGIATMLGVVAMVAGLSAARMLTDPEWIFTRDDPPAIRVPVPRIRRRGDWPGFRPSGVAPARRRSGSGPDP